MTFKNRSKSCHGNSCEDQQKSLRKMHPAVSAPIHVKVPDAGLQNVLKISVRGLRRNVFPQLAGPVSIKFWYLPLPFINSSRTTSLKYSTVNPFLSRISFTQSYQLPSHPGAHPAILASCINPSFFPSL